MRWGGFQIATGKHLLSHLMLGDLRGQCGELRLLVAAKACGPPRRLPLSDMLRLLALGDLVVLYVSQFCKAVSLQVARQLVARRRLGYVLEMEEALLSLYRQLLPTAMWLQTVKGCAAWGPLAFALACAYLLIKARSICLTLRLAVVAFQALIHNRLPYGVVLPELPEGCAHGGHGECSICRDDMTKPVRLSCGHVFCDGCIVDWLEATMMDGTCPLCRSIFLPAHLHMSLKGGSWLFPHLV